jgi:hypothetical protein
MAHRRLEEEFNIDTATEEIVSSIENMSVVPDINEADKLLAENIYKANLLLDKVVDEAQREGITPRMAEVGSYLANAVTVAVEKIYTKNFQNSSLQIKHRMLNLKEKELELKLRALELHAGRPTVQHNVIIADRESVLKLLKENREKRQELIEQ